MALLQHFEKSGSWLFRWRSYLPVLLFVVLLFGLRGFHYPNGSHNLETTWQLICFAIGLLGLILRGYTIGHAARSTSGRITRKQEAASLNTTGIYSIVRHPLYVGNYLMWLSVSLLTRNIWVVLVISLIFWLYYERIMFAEEAFLRGKFGAAFEDWASRVPAFLPRLHGWAAAEYSFQPGRVLRSERSALISLVLCFAAFDAYVDSRALGTFHIDKLWIAMVIFALLFYFVIEVTRKRARTRK